jgi:anti-anti-sigma factor
MSVSLTEQNGVPILAPSGPDLDYPNYQAMRETFAQLAGVAGAETVIVDMQNLEHIDSVGFGALIGGRIRLRETQEIRLCSCNRVLEVELRMARFDLLFPIYDSVGQALQGPSPAGP